MGTGITFFSRFFYTVTGVLKEPRRFFSEGRDDTGLPFSIGFLIVCAIMYTAGFSTVNLVHGGAKTIGISLVNAMGMVFISTGFCYLIMVMFFGKRLPMRRLFGIFSRASGVTLLAAWLPFFVFLTEPWKWWLVWVGLIEAGNFRRMHAFLLVLGSIALVITFVYSFLAMM